METYLSKDSERAHHLGATRSQKIRGAGAVVA
jgi:hypothetical protein